MSEEPDSTEVGNEKLLALRSGRRGESGGWPLGELEESGRA